MSAEILDHLSTVLSAGETVQFRRFVPEHPRLRAPLCDASPVEGLACVSQATRMTSGDGSNGSRTGVKTDTAKDRIFTRMKIPAPAPGLTHLPDWIEDEYLEQLTSEKAVRRYRKGRGAVREYIKTRERNEALDLEVYALAALYSLGNGKLRSLEEFAMELAAPLDPKSSDPAKE